MAGQTAASTPGPWHVRHWHGTAYVVDSTPDRDGVFMGHVVASKTTCPNWNANAPLIAAAPDLLAACDLALRILDRNGIQALRGTAWTDNEREQIEAAIAKARGEN